MKKCIKELSFEGVCLTSELVYASLKPAVKWFDKNTMMNSAITNIIGPFPSSQLILQSSAALDFNNNSFSDKTNTRFLVRKLAILEEGKWHVYENVVIESEFVGTLVKENPSGPYLQRIRSHENIKIFGDDTGKCLQIEDLFSELN